MKGLKFIFFLGIIGFLILLFVLPFYYSDISTFIDDVQAQRVTVSSGLRQLGSQFKYMDGWNVLGLMFLASCIMVTHAIVDHFLLYRLNKYYSGKFILDGLLWLGKRLMSLTVTAIVFIFFTNIVVDFYSNIRIMNSMDDLPKGKFTVLLLGTNKVLQDGASENLYYTNRINAVVELYNRGYINQILISGDNSRPDYNEPADMRLSLIKKGVPAGIIRLDFAGFRTLDSIVRSKQYFGIEDLLIVSQGFHLQRALFLSWYFGVDALGYAAVGNMNFSMFVREHLAVPKMVLDILVLNTQPEYGSTGTRRALNTSQEDIVLVSFVLIMFSIASYVSYDAFDFGK